MESIESIIHLAQKNTKNLNKIQVKKLWLKNVRVKKVQKNVKIY